MLKSSATGQALLCYSSINYTHLPLDNLKQNEAEQRLHYIAELSSQFD